jgi:hypothetical protein
MAPERRPRVKRLARRLRPVVFVAALVVFSAVILLSRRGLLVVIYNDTGHQFQRVEVAIGSRQSAAGPLAPDESIALHFSPPGDDGDVRLLIDGEPPLTWSSPGLATGGISVLTLRVDDFGRVTVTVEPRLLQRLGRLLE